MRIYTKGGDLAFKSFTFPDGQPHFILETFEVDFKSATIETAIKSPNELLLVLLVSDVLRQHGYSEVNLDIRYLMGARMDRAISSQEPFTLQVVARLINGAGFSRVRILDCHSEVATRLIRNSENVLPVDVVEQVIGSIPPAAIVVPDKGARERVMTLISKGKKGYVRDVIFCTKERDMATGTLSKFVCPEKVNDRVLIIDDICDGGGTFVGLAKVLREAGAKKVSLFITHAIMSKGINLEGIDHIYTTGSYFDVDRATEVCGNIGPVCGFTVIPISMRDM